MPAHEGYQKPRIGNTCHEREKPLRVDKSRGRPRLMPASRMNRLFALALFAFSNCSRTICPCERLARAAVSCSQEAVSLLRRIVIV